MFSVAGSSRDQTTNDVPVAGLDDHSTAAAIPSTSRRRQALLDTNFFVPSRADKEKMTEGIAVFVATTCSSYSIVERPGFRHMMKIAMPNYQVPCRKTFSDRKIPALYIKMQEHVKYVVSRAPFVSLTMDAWTAGNKRHFVGVTCAFVTSDWRLESFALACREADFKHTGDNLKVFLEDVLQDFGIVQDKVSAITTDRGANMLSAVTKFGGNKVPCFVHALNTIVAELTGHSTVKPVMDKIREIYNIFAYSANANREMKVIQREKNIDELMMHSSSKTRWWSELHQIDYVLSQEEALTKFLKEYAKGLYTHLLLEHHQVRLLKTISALLCKLEIYSDKLSVEAEVTASALLKSVQQIAAMFRDFRALITDPGVPALHSKMRALADVFINIYAASTAESSHIDMATFLDPRFERNNNEAMHAVIRLDAASLEGALPNNEMQVLSPTKEGCAANGNLSGLFTDDEMVGIGDVADPLENEISRYGCEPRISYSQNVLDWWRCRQSVYPILSQIARKYLCISASSVAIERVFSAAGQVLTKYRLSLEDKHAEQLIFLTKNQHNIPIFKM